MNKNVHDIARRLHEFVADAGDVSEAELRAELEAEGVDVDRFLSRFAKVAGKTAASRNESPTLSQKVRALASRTRQEIQQFLGKGSGEAAVGLPAGAFARSARTGSRRAHKTSSRERTGKRK